VIEQRHPPLRVPPPLRVHIPLTDNAGTGNGTGEFRHDCFPS
jgi:hypothetical protein